MYIVPTVYEYIAQKETLSESKRARGIEKRLAF